MMSIKGWTIYQNVYPAASNFETYRSLTAIKVHSTLPPQQLNAIHKHFDENSQSLQIRVICFSGETSTHLGLLVLVSCSEVVRMATRLYNTVSFFHSFFIFLLDYFSLSSNYFQELATQLRTVYELILQLQTHEEELHSRSLSELQALLRHEELVEEKGNQGQFGTSTQEEELNQKQSQDFKQRYIPSVRTQLRVLNKSYQVKYFICT